MQRSIFLHIEQLLKDYPRMNDYINQYQHNKYFSLDDEKRILVLKEQQDIIKETIKNMDDDTLEAVNALYFNREPNKTIDGVALSLNISRSTLFYRRNKFMEKVKKLLGW